jgi:integrase
MVRPALRPDWLDGVTGAEAVLVNRPLAHERNLSVFADDRWNLTPGMFGAHVAATSIDWRDDLNDAFRDDVKVYAWLLINIEPNDLDILSGYRRLHLRTIAEIPRRLGLFVDFLLLRGRGCIGDATAEDLDDYVDHVAESDGETSLKIRLLTEVRRLWAHRLLLPDRLRLPEPPPWGDRPLHDLVSDGVAVNGSVENSTRRIPERTLAPLLTWALRFVDEFADDIISAHAEYALLVVRTPKRRRESGQGPRASGVIREAVRDLVEQFRVQGRSLPGRMVESGLDIDYSHIARLLDTAAPAVYKGAAERILRESGLPVVPYAAVGEDLTGQLDDQTWRPQPISYSEAPRLARLLSTACLIVTAYLSGMRAGEVLNLRRGCVQHDATTGIWSLTGTTYKGQRDGAGDPIPQGVEREVPWVVVEPVADAVRVLERLHDRPLLFPSLLDDSRTPGLHSTGGLVSGRVGDHIGEFIDWVNAYCAERGRPDVIPADPVQPRIALSRFRRTLAWFINRRPRGLVAAAIQYGHVSTTVTLGYAGNIESGFPDDLAFERFLARLDDLGDAHRRLERGEHVSGPGADVYRQRVTEANHKFQGTVLTTGRQAAALLTNPDLQVYEGRGMTCVPQMGKQLCQERKVQGSEATPDLSRCQPGCPCLARTDRDLLQIRSRIQVLEDVVADPAAPPLRVARERDELDRLNVIAAHHEDTRGAGADACLPLVVGRPYPTEEADS